MPLKDPEAQRDFQRKWCAERRSAALVGKACVGCGSEGPLEFHHLDPAEKLSHAIWSWSQRRREAELAKCVTLCVPCHKAVTARHRRVTAIARNPHGTVRRYWLGCKCGPCRSAKAAYNRAHPPKSKSAAPRSDARVAAEAVSPRRTAER